MLARSLAGLSWMMAGLAGCSLVFDTEGAATGGGGTGGAPAGSTSSTTSAVTTTVGVSTSTSTTSATSGSSTSTGSVGCDPDSCAASCGGGAEGICLGDTCFCDCSTSTCQSFCFQMGTADSECLPTGVCACCPEAMPFSSSDACDNGCDAYCDTCTADCVASFCQCGD